MKYCKLGNSGIIVSEVGLGTMQFGKGMNMGNLGQKETDEMIHFALDKGINYIDTADVYSQGESEKLVGHCIKDIREDLVLSTKVRLPMGDNFNHSGAHRVNIMREIERSLKRLQTDYIDLYQIHGWDSNTPLEETLRALDDLVRQGKVRYIVLVIIMPGRWPPPWEFRLSSGWKSSLPDKCITVWWEEILKMNLCPLPNTIILV